MKLYCKKNLPDVTNLGDLRWYLFSKCEKDIENLPPTESSLLLAIHRAHYSMYIMKMSNTPIPDIPNFENYGWKLIDNKPQPIMTNYVLIPSDLVELMHCRCKTKCEMNHCRCYKNTIICRDLCSCSNCENSSIIYNSFGEESTDDVVDEEYDKKLY